MKDEVKGKTICGFVGLKSFCWKKIYSFIDVDNVKKQKSK